MSKGRWMTQVDVLTETLHRTILENQNQNQGVFGGEGDGSIKEKINHEKASEITKMISMICKCAYMMSELVTQRREEDEGLGFN